MAQDLKQFLTTLKSRLLVSDVVGRHVVLKKFGREWKGLSPFTSEKSPSFTVNDEKQFWHCFSSGEHGDIISFLVKTQNMTFMEAVEDLAGRAGLEVPRTHKPDPAAAARTKNALEALAAAQKFYMDQLAKDESAQGYLQERGLTPAVIKQFGVGVAPKAGAGAGAGVLHTHLRGLGFSDAILLEAGLVAKSDRGGGFYDRFRHRIMFPIDNRKGEVIGFGGRALDAGASAKYLNSPETPLFHKGDNFYGLSFAAQAAYDKQQLVVVEGYMDVIALHQAGCDYAVASLGTALTEQQIELAWRYVDEPVICLDGDSAGLRAAERVIDRTLKILRPGKSLRFAYMPKGQDPDDFVRGQGVVAFESYLHNAAPLSDSMFYKETEKQSLETPERRAALRQRFHKLINEIQSPEVQRYYRELFDRRLEQMFWRTDRRETSDRAPIATPALAPDGISGRERILLGLLIDQPALFLQKIEEIEKIHLASEPHQHLRDEMVLALSENPNITPAGFYEKIDRSYHRLLDLIYGRNEDKVDGHNFYRLFPALHPSLREHSPENFSSLCLAVFIHEQYHEALKQDYTAAHEDYLAHFNESTEEKTRDRWLKVKTIMEEDEIFLYDEIVELASAIDTLGEHMDYASGFVV